MEIEKIEEDNPKFSLKNIYENLSAGVNVYSGAKIYINKNEDYQDECQKFADKLKALSESNSEFMLYFTACEIEFPIYFNDKIELNKLFFDTSKFLDNVTIHCKILKSGFVFCEFNKEFLVNTDSVDDLEITDCTFSQDSTFQSKKISRIVFRNIIFEHNFSFIVGTTSQQDILFEECQFLMPTFFHNLNLDKYVKFFKCDLTKCSFVGSNIQNVEFANCRFKFDQLIDEILLKNKFININSKNENFIIEQRNIVNIYRQFEIIFDNQKDYKIAGEFHKKRYKLEGKISKNPINFLYKIFSNYGESYGLCLFWLLVSIFIVFPGLYLLNGINYVEEIKERRVENINGVYRQVQEDKKNELPIQYWNTLAINNGYKFHNDYGLALALSLNNSLPFNKEYGFKKVDATKEWTIGFSVFQRILIPILATLFIIALRRKFKR